MCRSISTIISDKYQMISAVCVALMVLFSIPLQAETLSGRDIIDRAYQNSSGFIDMTHRIRMVLIDESGDRTEREMLLKARIGDNGEASSLSIFTAPQREKGIALLTKADKNDTDEQWLYLPSTKRLKRITGASRTSSFRGSEFTFEDLSDQKPDHYRFQRAEDEPCGELRCYVVDRFPGEGQESSYSKTRMWIDTQHFRPMKADFYDVDGKLLKSMQAYGYSQFDNQFWNPARLLMTNLNTGKATELVSLDLKINTGLKASEFTELAIRSWR